LRNKGLVVCGFLYRCCPYWVESNNSLEDQRQRIKQRAEVGRSGSGVEIRRQAGRTVAGYRDTRQRSVRRGTATSRQGLGMDPSLA
jgi:hypothetical protein